MRLTLTLIFLLFIAESCNEKLYTGDVDCNECYTEEPEDADLIIDLTINSQYYRVPVIVYKGDVEDNKIIAIDTVDYSPFIVYVPVNEKYSVKAEYIKGESTLFVINGTKLKVLSVSNACDEACYVIKGESLDARIKKGFLDF